jgi:hypothetical protein
VACAAATVLLACGGEAQPVPLGPPAERHGAAATRSLLQIERVRARLVAAINLYEIGRRHEARRHLADAASGYRRLAPRVVGRDALLDREIRVALEDGVAGMARAAPAGPVLARLRPLTGQLLDGVAQALLPARALEDPGLRAEVLGRVVELLREQYAVGVAARSRPERRLGLQRAYGLLARAQILARGLSPDLGPQREDVVEPLAGIRDRAFPLGIERPPTPPPSPLRVSRAAARVQEALERRFRLTR